MSDVKENIEMDVLFLIVFMLDSIFGGQEYIQRNPPSPKKKILQSSLIVFLTFFFWDQIIKINCLKRKRKGSENAMRNFMYWIFWMISLRCSNASKITKDSS